MLDYIYDDILAQIFAAIFTSITYQNFDHNYETNKMEIKNDIIQYSEFRRINKRIRRIYDSIIDKSGRYNHLIPNILILKSEDDTEVLFVDICKILSERNILLKCFYMSLYYENYSYPSNTIKFYIRIRDPDEYQLGSVEFAAWSSNFYFKTNYLDRIYFNCTCCNDSKIKIREQDDYRIPRRVIEISNNIDSGILPALTALINVKKGLKLIDSIPPQYKNYVITTVDIFLNKFRNAVVPPSNPAFLDIEPAFTELIKDLFFQQSKKYIDI